MNNVVILVRSASNNENNYCSQLLRGKCMYQLAKLYITNVICFFFFIISTYGNESYNSKAMKIKLSKSNEISIL